MMISRTDVQRRSVGLGLVTISTMTLLLAGCAGLGRRSGAGAEERFKTPKAAVDALLAACAAHDESRLLAIFGERAKPIVSTGDATVDRERCDMLTQAAKQATRLDPQGPDTLQLVVGVDDWPMPIPLVKDDGEWHFDTARGVQEISRRRIGADELEAITFCRLYVLAQAEYAAKSMGGSRAYAQKLVSSPGTRDGLYWPSSGGRDVSPLGPMEVDATGATTVPHATSLGYHFRMLTAQGSQARGGRRSYVVGGKMTRGFALVAYPVVYGSSGIMTFIVGEDGRVYQKDLGEKTGEVGATMTEYDPDGTWRRVTG